MTTELEDVILKLKEHIRDRAEIMSARPTYLLINCNLMKWADRLINPWKGRRARWLRTKK